MEIKRIVGKAKNWCNSVVAELDNGLYAWVPTVDDGKGEPIILTKENIDEYSEGAYAASWLFWDKWVPIMANGELQEDYLDIALDNFDVLLENVEPGDRYPGASMGDEQKKELKEEEQEVEAWCRENPDAYEFSGYDELLDDLDEDDDEIEDEE